MHHDGEKRENGFFFFSMLLLFVVSIILKHVIDWRKEMTEEECFLSF